MSEEFKLGDFVWAKMKGWSPWPGVICELPNKTRRGKLNVYFFGTNNHAWIELSQIKPYEPFKEILSKAGKSSSFKSAVEDIEKAFQKAKNDPSYDVAEEFRQDTTASSDFDKLKENDTEEDTPKKKKAVKRTSTIVKTSSIKKKRTDSSEENGASPSYTRNHVKNYDEILNRPTVYEPAEEAVVDLNNISESLKKRGITASTKRFGFLGLGIMGSAIVKNLINSGHKVNVWSRSFNKAEDLKKQAEQSHPGQVEMYKSPSDIVQYSDIIFCCVSDPDAVRDIVAGNCGVLESSLVGKGYVEMTTIDCETSVTMSNLIMEKGGKYLEVQLQGSKKEANDGDLIILGAGDKELFEDCQTCFTAIGKTVFYLGDVGFATKMNLILQLMKGIALVGLSECLALADRSGLSSKVVLEIFGVTDFSSPFLQNKAEKIVSMDFQNAEQPLQHMQKDMRLALQYADTLKQPLLVAATANEVYKHARRLGYDSYDASCVYMRARH